MKEEIGEKLVDIMNCQLDRLGLMESGKRGATRLPSKLGEGEVPRVDQLRPITLLCLDYKILTKMPTTRYAFLTAINI